MEHGAKTDELDPDNLNLDNNLDPSDRLWQRNRFAAGPLVFGIIGIVASPLLLGLALGALGMRAGIDLWRNGTRRMVVAVGIALSFFAVVTSVIAALLWGSVLATVLLGRDAMREAERWRGRTVEPRQIETLAASGATTMSLAVPDGAERLVLIFVSTQTAPSAEALVLLGELMPLYPSCRFLVCDPLANAAAVRIFAMLGELVTSTSVSCLMASATRRLATHSSLKGGVISSTAKGLSVCMSGLLIVAARVGAV